MTRYSLKEIQSMMKQQTCAFPAGMPTTCTLVARGMVNGRVLKCELEVGGQWTRLVRTVEFPTDNPNETQVVEVTCAL